MVRKLLTICTIMFLSVGVVDAVNRGGGTPSSVTYAHDDFTTYTASDEHTTGGNWTGFGTAFTVDTTNDELSNGVGSGICILSTDLGSPDQIIAIQWNEAARYTGVYLRSNNSLSRAEDGYALRGQLNSSSSTDEMQFRSCNGTDGVNCTNQGNAADMTTPIDDGDWTIIAISGDTDDNDGTHESNEYLVRLWDNGTTDPDTNGDDELSASEISALGNPDVIWCDNGGDGNACAGYTADDTTIDIGGLVQIDDGNYVGKYTGSTVIGTIGEVHARALP